MGMPELEKLVVNSPVRTLMQHLIPTPFFLKHSNLSSRSCCLEIGCGQGTGAEIILKKFKARRVVALDYDPEQVWLAQKKVDSGPSSYVSLLVGDAAALSFAPARFEAVFDYGILHHVPAWRQALAEVYRVLKPGGYFFYEDVLRSLLESYLFRRFFPHPPEGYFSRREFEQALIQVGFELRRSRQWGGYLLGVAQKLGDLDRITR